MDARITTPPGGHAAVYDAVMWPFERAAVGAWRRRLAARARGRVLEIGAGHGRAAALVRARRRGHGARARRRHARARAAAGGAGRRARHGRRGPRRGAAVRGRELRHRRERVRALHGRRPGGGARRAPPGAGPRRARCCCSSTCTCRWQPGRGLQSRAAPAWAAVAGGCRLDRDTVRFAREAGFIGPAASARTWPAGSSSSRLRSPVGLRRPPISA